MRIEILSCDKRMVVIEHSPRDTFAGYTFDEIK